MKEFLKHLALCVILLLVLLPFYLMVVISLKDNAQFAANPYLPTLPFHFENYLYSWEQIRSSILNTIFVAVTSTVGSLVLALGGAFFFARYRVFGGRILFGAFMLLLLYPGVANMVPTFKLIGALGLYNSHWSLILLSIAGSQAFLIYVLKEFIAELPEELFDAADVDGCPVWRQVWVIALPLSAPILGTLGVLHIIGDWNNFVSPLLMLRDPDKQLIGVQLLYLDGEYCKNWGGLMAGYTIASLPLVILFFFCMKLFVRSLSEGAVKG